MNETPKSSRIQIGIYGRTNVGKSSFLNLIAGQNMAITSEVPGTTTDIVEKAMELLPLGPVLLLDTAGIDDVSELASKRMEKTFKTFQRVDAAVLIAEPLGWGEYESRIISECKNRTIPVLIVINKIDLNEPTEEFFQQINKIQYPFMNCCSLNIDFRDRYLTEFKRLLLSILPSDLLSEPTLLGDLIPNGGTVVMVVPIDLQAPKGRLILPQVQTIRDAIDHDAAVVVVKEKEYAAFLNQLKNPPSLVICDSQVVQKMVADTPLGIPCTTFSILFARYKSDFYELVRGLAVIDHLKQGDRVLVAEACTHHSLEDDIGKVKIPRWLLQYTGKQLKIEWVSGKDYPDSLNEYRLVIHCGACMLNRKEMLSRTRETKSAHVYVTNYGLCISYLQGVIRRVLSPFPYALSVLDRELKIIEGE